MTESKHCKQIAVRQIDPRLYEKLKHQDASVHSVYAHTINLLSGDALIAIGSNFSFSNNRMIVEPVNFSIEHVNVHDPLKITHKGFQIGNLFFDISEASFHQTTYNLADFKWSSEHRTQLLELLIWFVHVDKVKSMWLNQQDIFTKYLLTKIYRFLKTDTCENAQQLVGLGMGSTPLGDDVLLGYFIAKGSLDKLPLWTKSLIDGASEKTTPISYHSFLEAYDRTYTEHIYHMLYDFYMNQESHTLKEWMHYGDTSGVGILAGFIFGLLSEGGMKSEGLEIIDQYLF